MLYDTRLDMIQMFLKIYNGYLEAIGKDTVTDRSICLLSFYINYGYSDDTRSKYIDSMGTSRAYVSVLDNELKRRGFLVDKNNSFKNRRLSMDMMNIRNYFVLDGEFDDMRIIGFVFKRRELKLGKEKQTDIVRP